MKYCPNCGTKLVDNSKFCHECGANLSSFNSEGSAKADSSGRKVIYTPRAEDIVVVDDNDKSSQYTQDAEPAKKKSKLKTIIPIAIVVVFLLILIAGGTSSDSSSSIENTPEISKEEYISQCSTYAYEDIARDPDNYEGFYATFTGQVIQVQESGSDVIFRVNVTRKQTLTDEEIASNPYLDEDDNFIWWEDTIYVTYTYSSGESRILEDDIVRLYGKLNGIKTYTTVLGNDLSIPELDAKYIELVKD